MTLYKVRIMKKVAIVTPEALKPRSFIWDQVAEAFRVKISNVLGNTVEEREDGLYIPKDEGATVESSNVMARRVAVDGVINLLHFDLRLDSVDRKLRVDLKNIDGDIQFVTIINMANELSARWSTGSNNHTLAIYPEEANSFRCAYEYNGRIYVIDIFVMTNDGSFDNLTYAFADVVINAKKSDFPLLSLIGDVPVLA